jgi:hypothetical protein
MYIYIDIYLNPKLPIYIYVGGGEGVSGNAEPP